MPISVTPSTPQNFISSLTDVNEAQLTRAILMGRRPNGNYTNVALDSSGELPVRLRYPITAFGDLRTAELTPFIQLDFNYNLNPILVDTTVTGSGTATQASAMAVLQTTAAASSSAAINSDRVVPYRPGFGILFRYTGLFTDGVANSTQIAGCFDLNNNGLFFGFNGNVFGIRYLNAGSEVWIPQAAWNVDRCSGAGGSDNPSGFNLDPKKLNVYQLQLQYLGAGNLRCFIEDSSTGRFIEVHQISYANQNTAPSFSNASFVWYAKVENTSNTSNIIFRSASVFGGVEGQVKFLGDEMSANAFLAAVGTTSVPIMSIKSGSTSPYTTHNIPTYLRHLSAAASGTKSAVIEVYRNATLGGGATSWTDVLAGVTPIQKDVGSTTVSGGTLIFSDVASPNASSTIRHEWQNGAVQLRRGDIITVAAKTRTATTDVDVALNWLDGI